jgi:hypothetical protein
MEKADMELLVSEQKRKSGDWYVANRVPPKLISRNHIVFSTKLLKQSFGDVA